MSESKAAARRLTLAKVASKMMNKKMTSTEADDNEGMDEKKTGEDELEDDDEDLKDYNAPPPMVKESGSWTQQLLVIEAAHESVLQVTDAIVSNGPGVQC
ncbi:hypothetical protein JCM33374_g6326 [Metschnikowia sp. JCM 33374]|nr:hypothetical protein JCM33374_g6326 [Metschnikowia sp. JCM 33374]